MNLQTPFALNNRIFTSTVNKYLYKSVSLCVKVESAENGVGADDSRYLANLAQSLATYSKRMTAQPTTSSSYDIISRDDDDDDDVRRQSLWLTAGNLAAVIRGVRSLASARVDFTATPCSYDEVRVKFAVCLPHCPAISLSLTVTSGLPWDWRHGFRNGAAIKTALG